MGSHSKEGRADEYPVHQVQVKGFWMDETEVTNAQFAAFVKATGYVTTAEKAIDWEEMKNRYPLERLNRRIRFWRPVRWFLSRRPALSI